MHFIEQIKNKLIKNFTLKLLFYSIIVFLVILAVYKHSPPNVHKKTLKYQGKSHLREPTDFDEQLIIEEKKHFIVNLPKNNDVHYKEQNKSHHRTIDAIITAYTSGYESTGKTQNDPTYEVTASGKKVIPHLTVACPPSIPLGTWIKIQGIGRRRCDDRGGKIKTNKFDLYIASKDKAIQFGVQHKTVWVLE